jgi:hypothetical protein
MNNRHFLYLLVFLGLSSIKGHAELEFEKTTAERKAGLDDTEVVLEYTFKVKGTAEQEIRSIDPGCDCISATADAEKYAPGAQGTIRAVFAVGVLHGVQEKTITVETSGKKYALQVKVTIEKVFEIQPPVAKWMVGDATTPKIIKITVLGQHSIKLTKADSSQANVTAKLTEKQPGKEYELSLTPQSTTASQIGFITVETDSPHERLKRLEAFYTISKPKQP